MTAVTMPFVAPARTKSNPLGIGRNPRAREAAKINITFRLTPTESVAYRAAAEVEGLTLGDWIRAACESRLPSVRAEVASRLHQIRGKRAALVPKRRKR